MREVYRVPVSTLYPICQTRSYAAVGKVEAISYFPRNYHERYFNRNYVPPQWTIYWDGLPPRHKSTAFDRKRPISHEKLSPFARFNSVPNIFPSWNHECGWVVNPVPDIDQGAFDVPRFNHGISRWWQEYYVLQRASEHFTSLIKPRFSRVMAPHSETGIPNFLVHSASLKIRQLQLLMPVSLFGYLPWIPKDLLIDSTWIILACNAVGQCSTRQQPIKKSNDENILQLKNYEYLKIIVPLKNSIKVLISTYWQV